MGLTTAVGISVDDWRYLAREVRIITVHLEAEIALGITSIELGGLAEAVWIAIHGSYKKYNLRDLP